MNDLVGPLPEISVISWMFQGKQNRQLWESLHVLLPDKKWKRGSCVKY